MVIGVMDGDGENDPAPKFLKVRCRPRAVSDDELDKFQITRAGIMAISVGVPEQGHG